MARDEIPPGTLLREISGDAWGWRWLEHLAQDVLYSLRQLRLNPGFAAAAILSLALGIGANAAIFQLLNAVRLRVLPVESPQEIVEIRAESLRGASGGFYDWNPQITYAQWEQIQRQHEPFVGVFAWAGARFNLELGGEARYASGILASGEYFRVLGVSPFIGRLFDESDDQR
ncbi:MAG: ABC transporter permease, partial [Candidatus Binatia bacterium]